MKWTRYYSDVRRMFGLRCGTVSPGSPVLFVAPGLGSAATERLLKRVETILNVAEGETEHHVSWVRAGDFPKLVDDGHDVRLWESHLPATFYRIEVLPTRNGRGEMRDGMIINTGSGDGVRALVGAIIGGFNNGTLGTYTGEGT